MLQVHKIEVQEGRNWIDLPLSAIILSAGLEYGKLCLWAMADPEEDLKTKEILVVETGTPFDGNWFFIGTVFLSEGVQVHVFEREED